MKLIRDDLNIKVNNKDRKLYRKLKGLLINLISFSYLSKNSKKTKRIRNLQQHFKLSEDELRHLWYNNRFRIQSNYNDMPRSVFRDNKDNFNYGSSGSNRNKVRYPSKKKK